MSGSSASSSPDRRRFLKLLGLVGLTSAGSAALALSEARPASLPTRTSPRGPAKAPADSAKATSKVPEISEDARALAGVIQRRYGRNLNAKQLAAVAEELDYYLQGGKRLREARLENRDEPDFTFRAS